MIRFPLLALGLGLGLASCVASKAPRSSLPERKRLTLEQTLGQGERVDFSGTLPDLRWAADGVHLERREKERTVWIDPATWTETEPAAAPEEHPEDDGVANALTAAGVDSARAKGLSPRALTRGKNGLLASIEGALWHVQDGSARLVSDAQGGQVELAEFSPDETRVAFVQGNDLAWVELATGQRTDVTSDGSPDVFNGKLDWVYQEELYGRGDFKAFWWSPDSARLAFLRLDESAVFDFTVIDHIEEGHFRVKPEITRYPKVGDPNPVVTLGLVDVGAPTARWVDLGSYVDAEPLITRVDWAPEGASLWFQVQDRIQTWAELVAVDPSTLATKPILREASSAGWVERPESPRWLADGTFLWLSPRTGQQHLYRHRADGSLMATLTSGDWSVSGIEAIDEARGVLWFSGTGDGAVNDNLYRVPLDGSALLRLTRDQGRHSVRWNADKSLFLDRFSSLATPDRLRLCDGEGRIVRELGTADAPDLAAYASAPWELHQVRARDGFELDVALLKPVGFDPTRRYPVWLPTYSGPDAPSVRNSWNGSSWYQFLAQNGVIVLQVNVRSASGRGHRTTETVYRRLGLQELADLEDAVDWLCSKPWADGARVGITGGSYGGFMTAYALTHSDRFALGIAASGVFDWRMYDTIYTERYMSTPDRNPEGYAASSVIEAAANLKGHLVITHGVMDDNVHLQNALQLVYALQKAGQDFELMLYPQNRHGIRDPELRIFDRRLTWQAIQQHLLIP